MGVHCNIHDNTTVLECRDSSRLKWGIFQILMIWKVLKFQSHNWSKYKCDFLFFLFFFWNRKLPEVNWVPVYILCRHIHKIKQRTYYLEKITTLNNPYCTSKAARVMFSMKSLKIPPPSIPASSTPNSLTNDIRIWIQKEEKAYFDTILFIQMPISVPAKQTFHQLQINNYKKYRIRGHTDPRRSSSDNTLSWLKASSRIWSRRILNLFLVKTEWDPSLCLEAANCD